MSDVLARINDDKRAHVARRKDAVPLSALERRAAEAPPPRGFAAALARAAGTGKPAGAGRPALIAEIKKASPSRGLIRADFDPPALARAYQAGGAAALSVLTDTPYFQGRDEDLAAARAAVDLPVLRKDFILDPYQVLEARAIGADCILLIVAALSDQELRTLHQTARKLGLDVLVEVHDEAEMERALPLEDALLGVNNRNLKTLGVDLATFERLAPLARGRFLVAESGLKTAADVARVSKAGAGAILVGESLMAQDDVAAATRALMA